MNVVSAGLLVIKELHAIGFSKKTFVSFQILPIKSTSSNRRQNIWKVVDRFCCSMRKYSGTTSVQPACQNVNVHFIKWKKITTSHMRTIQPCLAIPNSSTYQIQSTKCNKKLSRWTFVSNVTMTQLSERYGRDIQPKPNLEESHNVATPSKVFTNLQKICQLQALVVSSTVTYPVQELLLFWFWSTSG